MHPVFFWLLGIISLVAALVAVGHSKPLKSILGLLVLMVTNSALLLSLSSSLVGIEWIAISLGGLVALWVLMIKPNRLNLGPAGRARLNSMRVLAAIVLVCFLVAIVWFAMHKVAPDATCPIPVCLSEQHGAWISLYLLGLSTVVACVLVLFKNRRQSGGEEN